VHTAPTVPSMLPKAGSDAPRTTMAALLRTRQTKQAILNAANAQAGKADSSSLKAQEEHNLQLVEKTKALETTIQHLLDRVVELEKNLAGKTTESVPKAEIDDAIKAFVFKEISTQIDQARQEMRQQLLSAETQLDNKIEKEKQNIKSLSSGFNTLADYKAITEQEVPEQFQQLVDKINKIQEQATTQSDKVEVKISALSEKFNEIQKNEVRTYNKASNNAKLIEYLEKDMKIVEKDMEEAQRNMKEAQRDMDEAQEDITEAQRDIKQIREESDKIRKELTDVKIVAGQVKTFQSELGKLTAGQKKLISGQDTISAESKALKIRLEVLEKKSNDLAAKSRAPVTNFSTVPSQADAQATAQMKHFSDDIKKLQLFAKEIEAPIALVTQIDQRLKTLEQLPEKFEALQSSHVGKRHIDERLKHLEKLPEKIENLQNSHIDERLKSLEQLPQKVEALNEQTSKLNQDAIALSDRVTKLDETAANPQASQRRPIRSQEDHPVASAEVSDDERFTTLWEDVWALQKEVYQKHAGAIEVLTDTLPNMLTKNFDPFKIQVHKDRDLTNTKLEALEQRVVALQQSSPALEETKVAIESLRQEIMPLQNLVINASQCAQDISSLKQQLLEKADASAIDEHMNNFRHSFRVLQDQYNNLTTDELHGKMVHWILQHYPTSTATMQQQYASLLQDVREVHELYAQLSWIPSKKPDLVALLENGPHQGHLSADEASESIKAVAIQATVSNHSGAIQSLQTALTGVQQSLQNLNTASFVKASVMDEAKKTIEALSDRFAQLDGASSALRQEHDALMQDFIEPNRVIFGMFGQMLALVGQIQVFTESVYMNFPTKDGKSPLPRPAWLALENGKNGTGTHKGKGKQ
jgi:DNA repair exonuclease SbcCD ATPase subunit